MQKETSGALDLGTSKAWFNADVDLLPLTDIAHLVDQSPNFKQVERAHLVGVQITTFKSPTQTRVILSWGGEYGLVITHE